MFVLMDKAEAATQVTVWTIFRSCPMKFFCEIAGVFFRSSRQIIGVYRLLAKIFAISTRSSGLLCNAKILAFGQYLIADKAVFLNPYSTMAEHVRVSRVFSIKSTVAPFYRRTQVISLLFLTCIF